MSKTLDNDFGKLLWDHDRRLFCAKIEDEENEDDDKVSGGGRDEIGGKTGARS